MSDITIQETKAFPSGTVTLSIQWDARAGDVVEHPIKFAVPFGAVPDYVDLKPTAQLNCAEVTVNHITQYGCTLRFVAAAEGICEWRGSYRVRMSDNNQFVLRPGWDASLPVADFSTIQGEGMFQYTDGAVPLGVLDDRPVMQYVRRAEECFQEIMRRAYAKIDSESTLGKPPIAGSLAAQYLAGMVPLRGLLTEPPQWWLDARTAFVERMADVLGIPADYLTEERRNALHGALDELLGTVEEHGE